MTDLTPDYLGLTANSYPALKNYLSGMALRKSPPNGNNMMEFYPPGELHSFDSTKPAIEIYKDNVSPRDIAGDVVSHYLARGQDSKLSSYYDQFQKSLSPQQMQTLQDQYGWSKRHEAEARPFDDWKNNVGIPAYFRGYAFGQWPNSEHLYTKDQLQMFDDMNNYLKGN